MSTYIYIYKYIHEAYDHYVAGISLYMQSFMCLPDTCVTWTHICFTVQFIYEVSYESVGRVTIK